MSDGSTDIKPSKYGLAWQATMTSASLEEFIEAQDVEIARLEAEVESWKARLADMPAPPVKLMLKLRDRLFADDDLLRGNVNASSRIHRRIRDIDAWLKENEQ